jgi:uncharacterized membrane protein YraQ (UPF0718 family)
MQFITPENIQNSVLTFSSILWEALPFIILGAVAAGILEELLPQEWIGKVMPRSAVPAVVIGGLLGLVFPMCECGIVVVMRRLLRKGFPLACCVSYMLAGPILNVVVLLSTYAAFGGLNKDGGDGAKMVLLRAGFGFVVAVVTGLVVHAMEKKYGVRNLVSATAAPPSPKAVGLTLVGESEGTSAGEPTKRKSVFERLGNISSTALHDFLDITTFLILGAVLATIAKFVFVTYLPAGEMERMSREEPYLAIPAMMLLAVVMCLCSEADAFVAASFTEMSVSTKLAFLVLGPMLDLKLLMMFTRVFRPRLIVAIVICTVLQVGAYMMLFHSQFDIPPGGSGSGTAVPTVLPAPPTGPVPSAAAGK